MTIEKKVTEKLTDTIWKGKIKDSKGRELQLRNPTLWDEYSLCKILGKDAESQQCMMMAEMLIKVASIDGAVMATPTSYNEFAANLNILGHEGYFALLEHMSKESDTAKEAIEEIKK